jgi:hypothetical protein
VTGKVEVARARLRELRATLLDLRYRARWSPQAKIDLERCRSDIAALENVLAHDRRATNKEVNHEHRP